MSRPRTPTSTANGRPCLDFRNRLITVARSHDRDTTKGGHADVIPMHVELVPFLEVAVGNSPSELVFPDANGNMRRRDLRLPPVPRSALARAGIVRGYVHVCRRCGFKEPAPDAAARRCPADHNKLWVKPVVRPIRFHDLRHTAASLMVMSGTSLTAVQRVLRHHDPKLTSAVYAHLSPEFLHKEVDRLSFGFTEEST